uniref:Uncharacterized protein n=1 Tax=Amphimedon queenslandica TaxID=400682 RepID=A0A1X7SHZ1_AMPQE
MERVLASISLLVHTLLYSLVLTLASLARTLALVSLATQSQTTIKAALLWVSLATTTQCRSIPTRAHHSLFASVLLTHGPTDDRLRQVVKHSAACFSLHLAVTLYVLFISLSLFFCSTMFDLRLSYLINPSHLDLNVNKAVTALTTAPPVSFRHVQHLYFLILPLLFLILTLLIWRPTVLVRIPTLLVRRPTVLARIPTLLVQVDVSDSLNDSIYRLLFMVYSFFIGFVSTVRLAGEYCSELTHHDITSELINIHKLSLYIMHAV